MPVEGMVEAVLLLLLAERPQYGYELLQLITEEELVAGRVRSGRIYETLRRLADAGFVDCTQEESTSGPDRLRYQLTENGYGRLARWRGGLERSHRRVGYFLHRCDRLLTRHGRAGGAGPPADVDLTVAPGRTTQAE